MDVMKIINTTSLMKNCQGFDTMIKKKNVDIGLIDTIAKRDARFG